MAAPTVVDADTTTGTQSSSSSSWSLTYPANIAAGDLILVFTSANNEVNTSSSGFVDTGLAGSPNLLKKKATGSESGSFTVSMGSSVTGHWVVYRITGWDGNIGAGWGSTYSASFGVGLIGTSATATSTTPDAPSLTSLYWGTESDTLWISAAGTVSNQTFSGFPSGYSDTYSVNDANGGSLALARKAATGSETENPGSFTIGSSVTWRAWTIGIRGDMGYPVIQDADTKSGTVTSNSTSWTVTYPTNIASGDLIMVIAGTDGSSGISGTGFTQFMRNAGASQTLCAMGKVADGSETGTFAMTVSASEQGAWLALRITDWYGGSIPTTASPHAADGLDSENTAEGASSTTPNPPNLDPGQWATEKTLWLASAANDGTPTTTAWPFGDRNFSSSSGGAGGANLMLCSSFQEVSSLDPGTFTISGSETHVGCTIAVRPAAAAGGNTYTKAGYGKESG